LFLGNTDLADGMTQLSGNYQVTYITQDGAKFGNFSGVSIGDDGVVTALFDNGVRRPVFQIPVATFVNPNGLDSLTGNTYIETDTSGAYTLRSAKEAGAGGIASASLESSTVDLGEEFTNMIITQRAYSASAKIITTTDQMLDELVNIKR
ncbi:MAG: flagellar hook-basal body complex protein, partial [Rhodospirillales bacterium]